MSQVVTRPLLFQELALGEEWVSLGRTITVADVVNFAGVSGDFSPIHVDHDYSAKGPFRQPIAHGLLGLVVSSGLGVNYPRVETIAFLGILEWKFVNPIYLGDTIHSRTKIVTLEPTARGRRGVVTWERRIVNQTGVVVQEGRFQTMVKGSNEASEPGQPAEPDNCGSCDDSRNA
jgi:3-hydroxybutyryl-CoA dehydratase